MLNQLHPILSSPLLCLLYSLLPFCLILGFTINRMALGLALLPVLCLFISVLALHIEARMVPDMFDCGPLQKHRYRCNPPLTRNIQADAGLLAPTDIQDTSSIQEEDQFNLTPTKIDSSGANGRTKEITIPSTSRAAHDHVEDGVKVDVATIPPALTSPSDPECAPLEKYRFRCNPPLIRSRVISARG